MTQPRRRHGQHRPAIGREPLESAATHPYRARAACSTRVRVRMRSPDLLLATGSSPQGGGPRNLLPLRTSPLTNFVQSETYGSANDSERRDLGTFANSRLYRQGTSNAVFVRNLEAPPGFEPGMEVLQGHPQSFLADPHLASSPPKSQLLNRMGRSSVRTHRGWRWLGVAAVGSSRAQFRHSSAARRRTSGH